MFAGLLTFMNTRRIYMDSRTYYYARVSSKEQNLDRQLAAKNRTLTDSLQHLFLWGLLRGILSQTRNLERT